MNRQIECLLAIVAFIVSSPMLVIISIIIIATSHGPVIHWSRRVGRDNKLFWMPKFRSMTLDTPQVATDLLANASAYVTPIGGFLRRTSLDELPQLWSVIVGDMSFVGPRPALFNQYDLTDLRTAVGVHGLRPGITGLAQTSGRDNLELEQKVRLDLDYLNNRSFTLDCMIIARTLGVVFKREGITH